MAATRELMQWQKGERETFIEKMKAFELQEVVKEPFMVLLQGEEGTGKTHFGCTAKELGIPIYIGDTERRARRVAQKIFGITTIQSITNWEETVMFVTFIIKNYPPGWFMFDSVTDIVTFAERRVLMEYDKEKIGKGWNWTPVYEKVDALFDMIKDAGFSLICTARMKDEYINETNTGKKKVSVYNRIPYKSDLVIQFNKDFSRKMLKPIIGPISLVPVTMETTLAELVRLFE